MEYIPLLCSCLFCHDHIGLPQSKEVSKYFPLVLDGLNQFPCFQSLINFIDTGVKNWLF